MTTTSSTTTSSATAPSSTTAPSTTAAASPSGTASTNTASAGAAPANTASANGASSASVPGPLNLLGSELGRLLNLRATWGYALAIVAIMAGIPMLMWLGTRGAATEFRFEPTLPDVLLGSDFAVIVAMIFAAGGSAAEIAGRRIAFGYLTSNSRPGVHVARMVAQVIVVGVAIVAGFAIAAGFLAAVGALVPEGFGGAAAHIGILLLWTVIGSAVGMLVPVTAVATGLPVAWILLVEVALGTVPIEFLNKLTEYLPWTASRQLLGMMDIGVSNVHAGLVLAAWSVAVIGGGIIVAARRDVK
ncbi:hypothetical protein [Corynebacterium freneyi]|uniref:ABC transporter permease n=1 Tax=Corynebacterium freneyi TaxID=134034 RepID=A0ABS4U5A4_9CORY|nr:hypothetical protein [Corynebacterium freneyi]MBP2331825.1 hypothetical protein [Corynebacterium freneyi]QXA53895.1 hypothetical protein I6L56_06115 [Corynebacterium freneyi]UBI01937.1 hypothetical protein LA334_10615 [Corynebacterium freneyi]WJZ06054.1 ABC-2 family transporter protein [Corynebacterium freneyi]